MLRSRQPQERRVQRGARARRRRGLPRVGARSSTICATSRCRSAWSPRRSTRRPCWRRPGCWTASRRSCDGRRRERAGPARQACTGHVRPRRVRSSAPPPTEAVVLEDAVSGVRAGAAGGFALVDRRRPWRRRRRPSRTPAPRRRRPTSPSWSPLDRSAPLDEHGVRTNVSRHPLDRGRFPIDPWRLVETTLPRRRPRHDRDAVHRRQRLPRHARQPRGGSRRPTRTAPSSTASTRPGRSGTPRRPSASPAPGRRSSTSPTPSS